VGCVFGVFEMVGVGYDVGGCCYCDCFGCWYLVGCCGLFDMFGAQLY